MKTALGEKVNELARVTADGDEHQQTLRVPDEHAVDSDDTLVFCAQLNGVLEAFDLDLTLV